MVATKRLLSQNRAKIMKELANNQAIVKLLKYNDYDPFSQPDVVLPAKELYLPTSDNETRRIFPYGFSPTLTSENKVNVRVYYPSGHFEANCAVSTVEVRFDIICAKSLWLCKGESVRPTDIMDEIVDHFNRNSIDTIGRLSFQGWDEFVVNDDFGMVRLVAEMMLLD